MEHPNVERLRSLAYEFRDMFLNQDQIQELFGVGIEELQRAGVVLLEGSDGEFGMSLSAGLEAFVESAAGVVDPERLAMIEMMIAARELQESYI